eukprot:4591542-Pyramimonas_sp.AAC.1
MGCGTDSSLDSLTGSRCRCRIAVAGRRMGIRCNATGTRCCMTGATSPTSISEAVLPRPSSHA